MAERSSRRSRATSQARAAALALLLWLAPGVDLGAAPAQPPASLEHARASLESGDGAAAEREFRRLLLDDPERLEALVGWGRALALEGRGAEALSALRRAAERRLAAGEYAEAVELLELATELDPGSARTRARLGHALILDRRHLAAERPLRQALALGGRDPEWLLHLGAVVWEKGELEEAERLHREAAERANASPVTWAQLGRFLLWRGRHAEAAEVLERARALGAGGLAFELDRAQALDGQARLLEATDPEAAEAVLQQARDAFRGAVELAPEHSGARYGLARVLARLGEDEQAARQLAVYGRLHAEDQALTRQKGLAQAGLDRARELLGRGQAGEAMALLATLPETVEVLATLALAQRRQGDRQAAARTLERALVLDPARSDLRALLVEIGLESSGPG